MESSELLYPTFGNTLLHGPYVPRRAHMPLNEPQHLVQVPWVWLSSRCKVNPLRKHLKESVRMRPNFTFTSIKECTQEKDTGSGVKH